MLAIKWIGDDAVVAYAAAELAKYLGRLSPGNALDEPQSVPAYRPGDQDTLWLGVMEAFGETLPFDRSAEDDEILINFDQGQGWISGSNPRSVLLGVYRFLSEAGFRWVRPGPEGEIIPQADIHKLSVRLHERAAYRHRAICIEGASSLENVLDLIDWSPKVGFSGYFMQFREGHTFFNRWYSHRNNPAKPPEDFPMERAREFTRLIESELKKRGMLYHAVGHGWTCEAFGIPGLGWDPVVQDWPGEVLDSLALVNGRRAMWEDIPLATGLCFSNPRVMERVTGCIVDYASTHPQIDYLHVWLDDGNNNKCECENCRKRLPSDFYIQLLNQVDERMTRLGLAHKIVFLGYLDMLWAPESERLRNPDRFVFMFAPISRDYREVMKPKDTSLIPPPFDRNHLTFPAGFDELFAFLRQWQSTFIGDSFDFDYHFMNSGSFLYDPEHLYLSRLLSQDIKNLRKIGLNGLVSCQIQRYFFPTGLGMYVMGRTLWDDSQSFEELAIDYFSHAFGEEGLLCLQFYHQVGSLQDVVRFSKENGLQTAPQAREAIQHGLQTMRDFKPVIRRNLTLPDAAQARSWFYVQMHVQMLEQYTHILLALVDQDAQQALRLWDGLKSFVQQNEDALQSVFDSCMFIERIEEEMKRGINTAEEKN